MLAGAAFPAAFLTRMFSLTTCLEDRAHSHSRRLCPSSPGHPVRAYRQVDSSPCCRHGKLGSQNGDFWSLWCLLRRGRRQVSSIHTLFLCVILTSSLPGQELGGTVSFSDPYCTKASVGYNLDPKLLGRLSNNALNVVMKGLAGSLVINAIAAGLAGISAIFALLAYFCSNRAMEVVSPVTELVSWKW